MTRKQGEDGARPHKGSSSAHSQLQEPPADIHDVQLEDLLAQLFDAAEDCFAEARQMQDDRDTQVEAFQQAAKLAKAYGQLLTVRNSHRKARKEDR